MTYENKHLQFFLRQNYEIKPTSVECPVQEQKVYDSLTHTLKLPFALNDPLAMFVFSFFLCKCAISFSSFAHIFSLFKLLSLKWLSANFCLMFEEKLELQVCT